MKPQIRPFSTITSEAIWTSAKHWVLLTPWVPKIIWSPCRTLASVQECAYARKPSLQAYPCTYSYETGEITPIPWPVLPGEVELEQWQGLEPDEFNPVYYCSDWSMQNRKGQFHSTSYVGRKDMRPSPRLKDGITVWVWEKDV